MSRELTTEKSCTLNEGEQRGRESLLRRFLPPHFFTPKVEENRRTKKIPTPPQLRAKSHWQPVTRKLGGGRTTHIALHKKVDDGSFYFKCPCEDVEFHVDRGRLTTAMASIHGSEWVCIPIGTDVVLRLKRSELRAAMHRLDE